jgi:hypothetical protein
MTKFRVRAACAAAAAGLVVFLIAHHLNDDDRDYCQNDQAHYYGA